ncbi:response regulator [Agarilytica rhodophyticola]|uniref:response regulator n=1 Tax=Agarilytica rhodophyticola TaxID=1737490 RepID=UPI000B3479E5|nr:response regulator [Agarilytica rhodophyticola]
MQKILIVEDEIKIAQLHKDYIEQMNFSAHIIDHGDMVIDWVKNNTPDLIVLDIMLPGKDGLSICKEIRQFSNVPIIMVTARIEEIDRILGLELGADDYVCKPVSPKEIVARVRANLRRAEIQHQETPKNTIRFDEHQYKAWLLDQPIELTAIEFQLLLSLANQPGRVFSRNQIMQKIYSDSRIVSDKTIDSHVKKIRKKLKQIDPSQEHIHSIYGVGFKYELKQ